VAIDGSANFLVVWASPNLDPSSTDIYGQRYAGSGAPLGSEFLVNSATNDAQTRPSVAADGSGNFVVVWMGNDFTVWDVFGQRYAATGAPLGSGFLVNTYTTDFQLQPAVASDPAGNFVVVWRSYTMGGGMHEGIYGQRYAVSGVPLGPEFRANSYLPPIAPSYPMVALDAAGDFVVTWNNFSAYGPGDGVFAQRYAGGGDPLGPEFRVNTFPQDWQTAAVVAADAVGDFVVVWQSGYQDGSSDGVYAQRFRPIVPVALTGFEVE
jgi:hypothetical protein